MWKLLLNNASFDNMLNMNAIISYEYVHAPRLLLETHTRITGNHCQYLKQHCKISLWTSLIVFYPLCHFVITLKNPYTTQIFALVQLDMVVRYSLRIEIFAVIDFFHIFNPSSYSKSYASATFFVCHMLYYCRHFKPTLSFYILVIIF